MERVLHHVLPKAGLKPSLPEKRDFESCAPTCFCKALMNLADFHEKEILHSIPLRCISFRMTVSLNSNL